jgi:hypothetical protein
MAGRKSKESVQAGVKPLGHSPFGSEKLEGPKKAHDFHGNDASRPGAVTGRAEPGKHWEMLYPGITAPSENMRLVEGADFNPRKASSRKTTHLKINETDH